MKNGETKVEYDRLSTEKGTQLKNHEVCMCFYLLSVMAYFYVAIIIHCHRIGYKREWWMAGNGW